MAQSLLSSFFKKLTPAEIEEEREKEREVTIVSVRKQKPEKRGRGRPKKVNVQAAVLNQSVTAIEGPCSSTDTAGPSGIQPIPSTGTTSTKIRNLYSDKQKRKIVTYARFHGKRKAACHFNVHRRNIQRWFKEEMSVLKSRGQRRHKKGQGRKLSYPPEKEEELLQWLLEQRDGGVPISTRMLQKKALSIVKPYNPAFKASEGWVSKFKKRTNLVLRAGTNFAQRLPKDLENKISTFRSELKEIRQQCNYFPGVICNMDETPAYFDMVSSQTLDKKGEKTIRIRTTGAEKRHLTVVLACSAAGDLLPAMVIFKGKREVKNVELPDGIVISTQAKAWVDETIMLKWIQEIWIPYTKGRKALLIFDSFRAHLTDRVTSALAKAKTTICVIPGGCTSILQPLDVSLNKPFKACLRASWEDYIFQFVEQHQPAEKIPTATKQQLLDWVANGCQYLSSKPRMIQKSFMITGLSNALSGEEDTSIRNETLRREIEEVMMAVFGDSSEFDSDDPLDTSSDSETDEDLHHGHEDDISSSPESVTPPSFSPISSPITLSDDTDIDEDTCC